MAYVDIVTALAVLQFFVFAFKVGSAREKFGIKAPATSGNEVFERRFRVQQNTLEMLIGVLPGLYLFARHVNPMWSAALGVVYLIGREIYSASYVVDPAKRTAGFAISFLPMIVLILGGGGGAFWQLIR
jgi:hypothetical protein